VNFDLFMVLPVQRPESHMPLNWNFPAIFGPENRKQVISAEVGALTELAVSTYRCLNEACTRRTSRSADAWRYGEVAAMGNRIAQQVSRGRDAATVSGRRFPPLNLCREPPEKSIVALLRLSAFAFPTLFALLAIGVSISALYLAVALHLIIIVLENSAGKRYADASIPTFVRDSVKFEEQCLFAWAVCHVVAMFATIYMLVHGNLTQRQSFALGAIFAYSINAFSATVGHELLHRHSLKHRLCADLLYILILYPHFPAVHLASHHTWAGTDRDCQSPRPGQWISAYLIRALVGGLKLALTRRASRVDPRLHLRLLFCSAYVGLLLYVSPSRTPLFLLAQGLISFLLVETLNYIQHYRPCTARSSSAQSRIANQDVNFVSRILLFNLSLHASHHNKQHCIYPSLKIVENAPTHCLGYWSSFWLAWAPPLWVHLHREGSNAYGTS
jgi:alkane 1-monooxygenase